MKIKNLGFKKNFRISLIIPYMAFLFLLSLSFCLMPLGSEKQFETKLFIYLAGSAFWLGLIGTICTAIIINRKRKKSSGFNKKYGISKQLGLVHFFANTQALIADVMMFISLIGFIIAKTVINEIIVSFVFMALFIFSFGMHCMLNGINYRFIKYDVRREKKQ